MVHSMRACIVLAILTTASVKAQILFCANTIFTSPFYSSADAGFQSKSGGNMFKTTPVQSDSTLKPAVSCSSTYMNGFSWSLQGDAKKCTDASEFGLGFWINFESKGEAGTTIILIGDSVNNLNTYKVLWDADGKFEFIFTKDSSSSATNSISLTIPLNEWTFFMMHWTDGNVFKIAIPGQAMVSMSAIMQPFFTKINSSPADLLFGGNLIQARIYQIMGFIFVTMSDDHSVITLSDGTDNYDATGICSVACYDDFCHPTQKCLSKTSDCTSCDTTGCKTCAINTNAASMFCNQACSLNCVDCSSATVCTQCKTGYFLYGNSGEVICICNFYLACAASCDTCIPGPSCFECAEVIVQDGDICRTGAVGYQLSFSHPNIEIDFANPLSSNLQVFNLQAKTIQGAPIDATKWTLNPCNKGSSSCIIVTDNLNESQLPVDITLKLSQA